MQPHAQPHNLKTHLIGQNKILKKHLQQQHSVRQNAAMIHKRQIATTIQITMIVIKAHLGNLDALAIIVRKIRYNKIKG